jgi:DNA-directed RNA polymerase specialized sigma24 family protein
VALLVPTEPGSAAARAYGCTCPSSQPQRSGIYERADDCPLHRIARSGTQRTVDTAQAQALVVAGFSQREIGDRLGFSESAVHRALRRAREATTT